VSPALWVFGELCGASLFCHVPRHSRTRLAVNFGAVPMVFKPSDLLMTTRTGYTLRSDEIVWSAFGWRSVRLGLSVYSSPSVCSSSSVCSSPSVRLRHAGAKDRDVTIAVGKSIITIVKPAIQNKAMGIRRRGLLPVATRGQGFRFPPDVSTTTHSSLPYSAPF